MANYFDAMFEQFKGGELYDVHGMEKNMDEFIQEHEIDEQDFKNFVLSDNRFVRLIGNYRQYEYGHQTFAIMYILLTFYFNDKNIDIELPYDFETQMNFIREDIGFEHYMQHIYPILYPYVVENYPDGIEFVFEEN